MLGEHYSEGGKYLPVGDHFVRVKDAKLFTYNSGTKGVEFELTGKGGAGLSVSFAIHPKSLWRLAQFAGACGMTKEEMDKYDENKLAAHKKLVGKNLFVEVGLEDGKDGKQYSRVVDFYSPDDSDDREATPKQVPPMPDKEQKDIPF